jgi:choline dehydrogenase-like flavoprotein
MSRVLVVGSGASGVHFALTALKKGHTCIMLDVGNHRPPAVNPKDTFNELKSNLTDPVAYFLGRNYEALVHPGSEGEYYGFPPNKSYVFAKPSAFALETAGFEPLFSFARGGLAETWTGGVYPLNEEELGPFPFGLPDIKPYYDEVAKRIGVAGVEDDLASFYPVHDHLMEPLRLDAHSERLLASYERHRAYINNTLSCRIGRSRIAVLSRAQDGREACSYTGRCLWGCPSGALYTPSITLDECRTYPNFRYVPGVYVSHFRIGSGNRIKSAIAESLSDDTAPGHEEEIVADRFVLAAGTLSSSRIFMDSVRKQTGRTVQLAGLMDNRQILIPFINLGMIGRKYDPDSYQYHQIAMRFECGQPKQHLHALITTLKSAMVHPILQNMPLDLPTALAVFRNLRAGLGIVNLNFGDRRRSDNFVTLRPDNQTGRSKLFINYSPAAGEKALMKQAVKVVRKTLWRLRCIVPPGMKHVRPMGASVHYAGTIPMSTENAPHTANEQCRSNDFENLYFVDGTTFPSLPAKNLTFALMANAIRVADQAF